MPEGPEHYKAAVLINSWCKENIFSGKVIKSAVNIRNPEIQFNVEKYKILAKSRGKELMLTLTEVKEEIPNCVNKEVEQKIGKAESCVAVKDENLNEDITKTCREGTKCNILFQFGMSGKFEFTSQQNIHKHSHLQFFTNEIKPMVLSFVDVRRFGKWQLVDTFSEKRGPDPVYEYIKFRKNILESLQQKVFKKPICVVMHDQKYFNGLGNYLRAEILYRAKVPPFEQALTVLENLDVDKAEPLYKNKGNGEELDFLELCSVVPFEVMKLDGVGYDPSEGNSDYDSFTNWLQCYGQPDMNNLVDSDGRTIWFQGDAGRLAPLKGKGRRQKHKSKMRNIVLNSKSDDKTAEDFEKSKNRMSKKRKGQKKNKPESMGCCEKKRRSTSRSNPEEKKAPIKTFPVTRRSTRSSTRI